MPPSRRPKPQGPKRGGRPAPKRSAKTASKHARNAVPKRGSKPASKHTAKHALQREKKAGEKSARSDENAAATDAPKRTRRKDFKPGVKPKPARQAGKKRATRPRPSAKPTTKRAARTDEKQTAAPKRAKRVVAKRDVTIDPKRLKRNTAASVTAATAKPKPSARSKPKRTRKTQGPPEGKLRVQKYLADAGFASRRGIEEMIAEGRIDVNGEAVVKLPCFVDPEVDEIRIDGQKVRVSRRHLVYFLLNKPKGVVCTSSDPQGRPVAVDMIPSIRERIHCVGRLDVDSTGIMLLTNDGDLTQHLTHPSYEVTKTYRVTVSGRVESDSLAKLARGMYLDGRRTAGVDAVILRRGTNDTVLEMTLREGRNREIRRMLLRLRHGVKKLHRIRIGAISDKGLKIGNVRALTQSEVRQLRKAGVSK
ncbi:MAG: pseudouridine synthase [Phycisphaerae bacterium]|nr:pseudouridine synthase [Phycisphaerae bacterium]